MAQHAKLSASSSERWLTCPASIKACESYENKSNSASQYGTSAHALAEMCLTGAIDVPENMLGKEVEGVVVDKEMVNGVQEYLDYIRSFTTKESALHIEVRVDFSHIVPEGFGTADCVLIVDDTLHIIDLKFGHNIVHAMDNSQLSLYALGAIEQFGFIYDFDKVSLHVVQPRANHFDRWDTDVLSLNLWSEWVSERAELALTDYAPFNPTAKACKYCLHQHNCEALKAHVEDVIKGDFDDLGDIDGQADKISTAHIKNILDNMDLINGFLKAVQQVAFERVQAGEKLEGYKLVESKKNKAWVADESKIGNVLLKCGLTFNDFAPRKFVTPTQALKLAGKANAELLDGLWETPKGEPVLVTESDKRPSISSVCDEFSTL